MQEVCEQTPPQNEKFLTEFEEVEGGFYDTVGCYILPDGSFWDPNGVYFNKDGLDSNGGFYDEDFVYHPGTNWNEDLQCYLTPDSTQLPDTLQKKLLEGVQCRFAEEYEVNKALFQTADEKQFNVNNVDCEFNDGMAIDNENDMIKSWVDSNLILATPTVIQNPQSEVKPTMQNPQSEVKPTMQNPQSEVKPTKIELSSASKVKVDQTDENVENVDPNRFTFAGDCPSSDAVGTPFKTKTSEILKQGGTPFQGNSVKKITLTTPKEK